NFSSIIILLLPTSYYFFFFFFNATSTTHIYSLSLHDALPISPHSFHRDNRHLKWYAGAWRSPEVGRTPHHGSLEPYLCRRVYTRDRKSTRLNSSHLGISYAVFCLKKKKKKKKHNNIITKTNII